MILGYMRNVGTALSQFANTFLLLGNPDESVSCRSYRLGTLEGKKSWWYFSNFINLLFFWEKNHCKGAYLFEVEKAEFIVARHKTLTRHE